MFLCRKYRYEVGGMRYEVAPLTSNRIPQTSNLYNP